MTPLRWDPPPTRALTREEQSIVDWLRRDDGRDLERYYERLRVAREIEAGAFLQRSDSQ